METFKPDLILAIADGRTTLNEGLKRVNKAVYRCCSMLDVCINRYKTSRDLQNSSLIGRYNNANYYFHTDVGLGV